MTNLIDLRVYNSLQMDLEGAIVQLEELKEKYEQIQDLANEIDKIRDDIKTVLEI